MILHVDLLIQSYLILILIIAMLMIRNQNFVFSILLYFLTYDIFIRGRAQSYPYGYGCQVVNCQVCSFPNFCGLCQNNYILQVNSTNSITYCQAITCTIMNCLTCYQNNVCAQCVQGYFISPEGLCIVGTSNACGSYCSSCNSTSCLLCQYGYSLSNGNCFPINYHFIQNCQSTFTSIFCQLCVQGYIVSPAFSCIPNPGFSCNSIINCSECNYTLSNTTKQTTLTCNICNPGYQINNPNQCIVKSCNVSNCLKCSSISCVDCQPQFSLLEGKCIPKTFYCNIKNCLYCFSANLCGACISGFYPQLLNQNNTNLSSICIPYVNSQITNCQTLGLMIPGTTKLKIGCVVCQKYFINVGGYCVANLTQSSYLCNISNCVYCVQNNICGKCVQGYNTYIGSEDQCIKVYSPIQNCQTGSIIQIGCAVCAKGYVLVANSYCILIVDNPITCNISGCDYCLLDNICNECMKGYQNIGNFCSPLCNISNCYQCDTDGSCLICNLNYYLSIIQNITQCQSIQNQNISFCLQKFGSTCTACSYYNCTECSSTYTLTTYGICCPSPVVTKMANCSTYGIQFTPNCTTAVFCTSCQIGSILVNTYTPFGILPVCVWLNCNISNCAYCYQSLTCKICKQGFYLLDNQCQPYLPNCNTNNCVQCIDNTNTCAICLEGYLLYNGYCVCGFQNCLSCLGSISCSKCAFPTEATITSSTGCLPESISFTLCTVTNCLSCLKPNLCSECSPGFSLLPDGTCSQNVCNRINFCALCDESQLFCYNCLPGYLQTSNLSPGCSPIASNYSCQVLYCSFCQPNNQYQCSICAIFYTKNNSTGLCQAINCIQNCVFCLALNTCVICQTGYYLTENNICMNATSKSIPCPLIPNCVGCQFSPGSLITICIQCILGMQPSSDGLSCVPQNCSIPNCLACNYLTNEGSKAFCLVCGQGYYLNSYFQCSSVNSLISLPSCTNIYNCIFCAYNGYCVFCLLGWMPINGRCVTNESTLCLVSSCLACTQSNICIKCATNYTLTSSNTCQQNCIIPNCIACFTETICESCINNMVVMQDDSCGCPDPTFFIINQQCICPNGQTANPAGLTCVICNILYCKSCLSTNECAICDNNMTLLSNNTCGCPDDTFNISNGFCVCPPSTALDNNTCIECTVQNCLTCNITNSCVACVGNLTLFSSQQCGCPSGESLVANSYCVYCQVQYCNSCISTNYCFSCNSSLLVVINGICSCHQEFTYFNNTCIPCSINNCILCQKPNNCSTCATGYSGPSSQNFCTLCQVPSCQICITPNYCTSCLNNLQVNSEGNQCVNCTITNCYLCSINNYCAVCNVGYQLVNARLCILCILQGCSLCSSDNVCQVCQTGYILTSLFTCQLCVFPCASCQSNSSTLCTTCQYPFSLNPSNNQCYTCWIQNCAVCSQTTPTFCSQCSPNYEFDPLGTCLYSGPCSINCITCLLNQTCLQCSAGFTISTQEQTQCVPCNVSNCQTCSPSDLTTCFVCLTGYFQQNGQCQACPFSNCQTCNAKECLTFQSSTNQVFIQTSTAQYAVICDSGCNYCSFVNPISCIICQAGYVLNQDRMCISCAYPCLECLKSNTSQCISCFSNFYLSGNECLGCDPSSNCLTCLNDNLSFCTTCPHGYLINNVTNACQIPCPNFCLTCLSPTICSLCIEGYSTNQAGFCLPCVSNCRICAQNFQSICLECGLGFYLLNNNCMICPQFCSKCNSMGCVTCFSGYFLNQLTCTLNCESPCATCLPNSPNACTSCLYGYTSTQNGSTVLCTPSNSCSSGPCQYCPIGYSYSNTSFAQCVSCDLKSNCLRCNSSNLSQCYTCLDGYYYDIVGSECKICQGNCYTCTSPSNCLSCISGYTIDVQSISSIPGKCIQCQSPCLQCLGNSYTCSACVDGYILNGWNCQTFFNFGFNLSLTTTSAIFYQNYGSLLFKLASGVNSSNLQTVTVINLQVQVAYSAIQPITMIGNISTTESSGSLTAYLQYTNLTTLFIQNGTFNGIQINSFSIYINNGQIIPPQPDKIIKNLPIILGICIPILIISKFIFLFLVIVFIIYHCYKKKIKQSQDSALNEIFNKIAQKSARDNISQRNSQMTNLTKKKIIIQNKTPVQGDTI